MNEDKIQRLSEWLATPPEDRTPKTQKELAVELGVSEPQLSIWKKELELAEAPPSEVTAFIKSVKKWADSGKNPGWATLYWNIINPKNTETRGAEFTAYEYANIGIRLREGLQEEYRQGTGSCPVCGRCKEICDEPHLDTEPEHEEDREVEAVDIPPRPD